MAQQTGLYRTAREQAIRRLLEDPTDIAEADAAIREGIAWVHEQRARREREPAAYTVPQYESGYVNGYVRWEAR